MLCELFWEKETLKFAPENVIINELGIMGCVTNGALNGNSWILFSYYLSL